MVLLKNNHTSVVNEMLRAAPDYINQLIGMDYIHCVVSDEPGDPDAIAWTYYDKDHKRWIVSFHPIVQRLSASAKRALWRHEVGHIAFAHFSKESCTPDDPIRSRSEQIIVGDIQVNTYLLENTADLIEVGELSLQMMEEKDGERPEGAGFLDPRVILPEIGLSVQEYPYEIIHAYLHQKNDDDAAASGSSGNWTQDYLQGACGGISQEPDNGDGMAEATASVISGVASEGGEDGIGEQWGSNASLGQIRLRDYDLPEWISALENHARSVVESVLADRRSHTRPQEIYKSVGVHMPTQRPRWAYKPDTVVFLVDTSGSMMDDLKYVVPVINYLNQHSISVRLIAGDTHVTMDEEFKPGTELPDKVVGGGGTEITPLFKRSEDYEPKSLVVFSDAYVPSWPRDPGIPCLIVGARSDVPSWMEKA